MPEEETYETVAGFIMYMLRRVPKRGDYVDYAGWRFEVTNMDGFHIDQVLLRRADHHAKHADKTEKSEKSDKSDKSEKPEKPAQQPDPADHAGAPSDGSPLNPGGTK